jgi:hypothetical protein
MVLGVLAPVVALLNRDWSALIVVGIGAAAIGVYVKLRYSSRVLERSMDRVVIETIRTRPTAGHKPLTIRTWILIAVGWVAAFVALAFLPDNQNVGAQVLLVIVTLIWLAYRFGRRRGAGSVTETTEPDAGTGTAKPSDADPGAGF